MYFHSNKNAKPAFGEKVCSTFSYTHFALNSEVKKENRKFALKPLNVTRISSWVDFLMYLCLLAAMHRCLPYALAVALPRFTALCHGNATSASLENLFSYVVIISNHLLISCMHTYTCMYVSGIWWGSLFLGV